MARQLWCIAVVALIFSVGCGREESNTGDDGCGCGAAEKTIKDAGDDAKKGGATMKTDGCGGDAAKDVTYKCKCGKEETVTAGADAAPPS